MMYEIIESRGIAPLSIGMSLMELREFIKSSYLLVTSEELEFDINRIINLNNGISVYIDKQQRVYKMSFSNKQFHWRNFHIGDSLVNLKSQNRYLLLDDFDRVFYLKEVRGICFETINKDFQVKEALKMQIDLITVYEPSLDEKDIGYELDEIDLETGSVNYS